jgi:hypothetical protein
MVDYRLDALDELNHFGALHVLVECRFIDRARM